MYLPVGVVAGTDTVMVTVPLPGSGRGLGLKPTVGGLVTVGETDADNVIAASNPVAMVLVIVEVPLAPSATEIEPGEGVRVNCGGGVTINLKVAV